jgi:hypothetical protein
MYDHLFLFEQKKRERKKEGIMFYVHSAFIFQTSNCHFIPHVYIKPFSHSHSHHLIQSSRILIILPRFKDITLTVVSVYTNMQSPYSFPSSLAKIRRQLQVSRRRKNKLRAVCVRCRWGYISMENKEERLTKRVVEMGAWTLSCGEN